MSILNYIEDPTSTPIFEQKKRYIVREIKKRGGRAIPEDDNWSKQELELLFTVYTNLLLKFISERHSLSLSETIDYTKNRLNKRKKIILLKMQYISSLLADLHLPYLKAFRPISRIDGIKKEIQETDFLKNKLLQFSTTYPSLSKATTD